jgi:hypothetical protein
VKRNRFNLPLLLALAGAAACSGGDDGGTAPPQPEPGVLTVSLTTPSTGDRALVVQVSGPELGGVEAASASYVVHSRATGPERVRAAVFGALGTGPLLHIQVPDVNRASAYSATVVEVADEANALRATTGYTAAVVR